jgi:hypothetical protein
MNLRSFDLKYVSSFYGDINELLKKVIAVFSIGPINLQENGIIPVEYECRRAEYSQVVYGVEVVFGKCVEDRRIVKIKQKPVHVSPSFFSNFLQNIQVRDIKMFLVNGI